MRELTKEELEQVSGASCADLDGLMWSTFSGTMGGALGGSRAGLLGAIGGGLFGGAISGAMYLISHEGPCES